MRTLPFVLFVLSLATALAQDHPKNNASPLDDSTRCKGASQGMVDSALRDADEAIDLFYDMSNHAPASMWYGDNFSSHRVRMCTYPLDSLPDEINLNLVRKPDEFCFPVKGCVNSPYGWRWGRAHRGVDINLKTGDPVHAAFGGVVRVACPMGGYGNVIVIRHHNGLETVYGHLSKIKVKPRQIVNAGDVIGLGGSTGHSTGPHLHFEVRFQYETFDPEWILDFKTYTLRTRRLRLDKTYFGVTCPRGKKAVEYKADASYVKERPMGRKEAFYVVKPYEAWEDVAIRHGISVAELKKMNPEVKRVYEGLKMRVR